MSLILKTNLKPLHLMLPANLHGPGMRIDWPEGEQFLEDAFASYPKLHPDFVRQACCEHPDRMDSFFPDFDLSLHEVVEREVTADWIAQSVRYDDDESLETGRFYGFHFDADPPREKFGFEVYNHMIRNLTWSFPPILVQADFANRTLGCHFDLGHPYHLFEGTHRISYLLKMRSLGLVSGASSHKILQIRARFTGRPG